MVRMPKRRDYFQKVEERKYEIEEAIEFLKAAPQTNFEQAIDVAVNLGIDASKSDQNVRSSTALPAGTGKSCSVAVFAEADQAEEAKKSGADIVGMEDLAEKLKEEESNYDVIIATPDTMKVVSPLAKILGPKGKMPNPKTGTVTKDVGTAVKNAKAGQITYRADNGGIVHGRIGNLSFSSEEIKQNIEKLLDDLKKNKPSSSKGEFIKKLFITSTMGPGLEIDMGSLKF